MPIGLSAALLDGSLTEAVARYRAAIDQGLLKDHAKMGISRDLVLSGRFEFRGGWAVAARWWRNIFPVWPAGFPGIGVHGIQRKVPKSIHGWRLAGRTCLPIGGFYKARKSGETHAWEAHAMHMLQAACDRAQSLKSGSSIRPRCQRAADPFAGSDGFQAVGQAAADRGSGKHHQHPQAVRDAGMSLGALSPEAHKTLNVAMNRIGAKSDSGEGGEDPGAFHARAKRGQSFGEDQAGRFGPLWRDSGVSQPLRRAGDQGRPRGQAR